MNRHYDIKPWECVQCHERFFLRSQAREHIKDARENGGDDNHLVTEVKEVDDLILKVDTEGMKRQVNYIPTSLKKNTLIFKEVGKSLSSTLCLILQLI